jgi:Sensors of blue-light using FAD
MKDTMQVRVLYVSRAVGPQTGAVTASILATAQAHNRQQRIGGVLCQGQGLYLQVLEGERSAVHRLYARIVADKRHCDVEMLHLEEVAERRYADWSMAHIHLADDDPMVQMKHPEFDPYSAPGAVVMSLVEELIASGHRISLPVA